MLTFDEQYLDEDVEFVLENYELSCSFHYDYYEKPKISDGFDVHLYRRKD